MSRPEALFVGVLAIGVGVVVTAAFFEQSESRAVTAAAPEHVELAAQLAVEATQQDKADARFALALDSAKAVKSLSRDPDSLQWELIGVDDEATVACLMYRSRNRLGGHRNEFAIFVNREVMTSGVDWKKHCTNVPLHDELEVAARLHSGEH